LKKLVLLAFLVSICLSACSPQIPTLDEAAIYTQAAMTVAVQLTQDAALLPTFTNTVTPEPTATLTFTPEPSPTQPTPTQSWAYNPAGSALVPILLYSHVSDDINDNPYYQWETHIDISSADFRQQMAILKEAGYAPISITLLINAIRNGADLPPRPIVITFDSDTPGIYRKAFPIMQEMGFIGNLFIIAGHLDASGTLTTAQVQELVAAGWEIGSKGMWGVDLTTNYEALAEEVSGSKHLLEEKLGTIINVFSYPYGSVDGMVSSRVQEWGYLGAVGLKWYETSEHTLETIYYLSRFEVQSDWAPEDFIAILPWKPDTIPTRIPTTQPPAAP